MRTAARDIFFLFRNIFNCIAFSRAMPIMTFMQNEIPEETIAYNVTTNFTEFSKYL